MGKIVLECLLESQNFGAGGVGVVANNKSQMSFR